jgi:hypothetical protein
MGQLSSAHHWRFDFTPDMHVVTREDVPVSFLAGALVDDIGNAWDSHHLGDTATLPQIEELASRHQRLAAVFKPLLRDHARGDCECAHRGYITFAHQTSDAIEATVTDPLETAWAMVRGTGDARNLKLASRQSDFQATWILAATEAQKPSSLHVTFDPDVGLGEIHGHPDQSWTFYTLRHRHANDLLSSCENVDALMALRTAPPKQQDLVHSMGSSPARLDVPAQRTSLGTLLRELSMQRKLAAARHVLDTAPGWMLNPILELLPTWDQTVNELCATLRRAHLET